MPNWSFDPIRRGLLARSVDTAAIDNLELALRDAISAATAADVTTGLGDLETTLRAEIAAAVREAVAQAHMLDFVPLTRDEIIALVDTVLMTEDGDDLMTEAGDSLLKE